MVGASDVQCLISFQAMPGGFSGKVPDGTGLVPEEASHFKQEIRIPSLLCGCPGCLLFAYRLVPSKPLYRRIVGGKIRLFRTKAGLTIEKLAEKADLHHNFVGELERGNYDASLGSLLKIAKALKVRVRDLVRDL